MTLCTEQKIQRKKFSVGKTNHNKVYNKKE